MIRKLILTGPRAGKTVKLRGYQFVNGQLTLSGAPERWEGVVRYMGRAYRAYEEGTAALTEAQEQDVVLRDQYQQLCQVYGVKMQRDRRGQSDPFSRHAHQLRLYHQERSHGQCEVHAPPESRKADAPPGYVQPSGSGSGAAAADVVGGDDVPAGGDPRVGADGSIEFGPGGAPKAVRPVPAPAAKLKAVTHPKPAHVAT
jgi:hypothetical protein